jgi:hypothetical protein
MSVDNKARREFRRADQLTTAVIELAKCDNRRPEQNRRPFTSDRRHAARNSPDLLHGTLAGSTVRAIRSNCRWHLAVAHTKGFTQRCQPVLNFRYGAKLARTLIEQWGAGTKGNMVWRSSAQNKMHCDAEYNRGDDCPKGDHSVCPWSIIAEWDVIEVHGERSNRA